MNFFQYGYVIYQIEIKYGLKTYFLCFSCTLTNIVSAKLVIVLIYIADKISEITILKEIIS